MNTDKTIQDKFIKSNDKPIWYYKELEEVEVDYVIWNLLKMSFVVEIEGSKHEIIFGKNRKHEIGQYIRYDDIKGSNLCSFEVVNKGFRNGKWYIITDIDTTEDFKQNYDKTKEECNREEFKRFSREILTDVINKMDNLDNGIKHKYIKEIDNSSYEQLQELFSALCNGVKED